MSTRSLICKEIKRKGEETKYKTIYCHSDGYLSYNGAMLLDHYNEEERVNKLLDLGNLSCLNEKIDPNPDLPHSFDYNKRQEDVCVAYGRDRGEEDQQAREYTLEELKEEGSWIEYIYIFTSGKKWEYAEYPFEEIKDLKKAVEKEWEDIGEERIPNYYGFLGKEYIKRIKEEKKKKGE